MSQILFRKARCALGPLAVFLLAGALLVSCKSVPEEGDEATNSPGGKLVDVYRIGVDDGLQISVWRNPELSISVPVRPDGKISVPLVGDVQAGGLTPPQLAANIREKLAAYVRDPNVTVIVTGLRSHEFLNRVRVTGAVRAARSMSFREGMTVLDAVLEAGGINDFAAANRTKLYRRTKTKTEIVNVELGDILYKGRLDTNFMLRPGDLITVPERLF